MIHTEDIETNIWTEPETDCLWVQLRIRDYSEPGRPKKKGFIFKFTEEQMTYVGEGCKYPLMELVHCAVDKELDNEDC